MSQIINITYKDDNGDEIAQTPWQTGFASARDHALVHAKSCKATTVDFIDDETGKVLSTLEYSDIH